MPSVLTCRLSRLATSTRRLTTFCSPIRTNIPMFFCTQWLFTSHGRLLMISRAASNDHASCTSRYAGLLAHNLLHVIC